MFCENCGEKLIENSQFCQECGARVDEHEMVENSSNTSKTLAHLDSKNKNLKAKPDNNVNKPIQSGNNHKPSKPKAKERTIIIIVSVVVFLLLVTAIMILLTKDNVLIKKDHSIKQVETTENEELHLGIDIPEHQLNLFDYDNADEEPEEQGSKEHENEQTVQKSPIKFIDSAFERMLRIALNNPSEPLYQSDLDSIEKLYIIGDKFAWINDENEYVLDFWGKDIYCINGKKYISIGQIERLDDLELLQNLTDLKIMFNNIKNVDGIGMTLRLKAADLAANQITDVASVYNARDLDYINFGLNLIDGTQNDNINIKIDSKTFEVLNATRYLGIVDCGSGHTLGIDSSGGVHSVGTKTNNNKTEVDDWKDVVAVAAGENHSVGLLKNGTVIATGSNKAFGQCNVTDWTDIIMIAASANHTAGLKSDGRVVATGLNKDGQTDVSEWRDIVMIAAGKSHTVGVKSDGTVVAAGHNGYGRSNLSGWTDIVAVAAGSKHTVGLKSDGTVVAKGWDEKYQLKVTRWENIVAVAAGEEYSLGLTADGKIKLAGSLSKKLPDEKNVRCIFGGVDNAIIIRHDDSIQGFGENSYGKNNISGWSDLKLER
jgi:hypothetical protein